VSILLAFTVIRPVYRSGDCHRQVVFQARQRLDDRRRRNTVGSSLIGQAFDAPQYFWAGLRAGANGYDPTLSGGSNLSSTSQTLITDITQRVDAERAANATRRSDRTGDASAPVSIRTSARRREYQWHALPKPAHDRGCGQGGRGSPHHATVPVLIGGPVQLQSARRPPMSHRNGCVVWRATTA